MGMTGSAIEIPIAHALEKGLLLQLKTIPRASSLDSLFGNLGGNIEIERQIGLEMTLDP